jgi:cytochrome bd-type quinol oxidase subunit 2
MVEQIATPETAPARSGTATVSIVSSSLAAVASLIAMAACCVPVLSFVLAAGFAGLGTALSAARPYLMAASVILIAYGFYQAARARKCRRRPSVAASILLWLSALIVAGSIFFPQLMANIVANLAAR